MAPNFLSKIVKAATPSHNRDRNSSSTDLTSPRVSTVIPRSRSQSTSQNQTSSTISAATSPTTPTQSSTLSSRRNAQNYNDDNRIPSIITTLAVGRKSSFESMDSAVSTQPNVTIVPPSPMLHPMDLSDDEDEQNNNDYHDNHAQHDNNKPVPASGQSNTVTTPRTTSTTVVRPGHDEEATTPKLPNQPPSAEVSMKQSGPEAKTNTTTATSMASQSTTSLAPSSFQIRKQPSNKSIRKVQPVTEVSVNTAHARAATTPAEVTDSTTTKKPIVESPTELGFPPAISSVTNGAAGSSTNLPRTFQRENTSATLADTGKKRPWKRSTTRKPTGLASAIAASGLAMANPSLSPQHQNQMSNHVTSPPAMSPQASSSTGNLGSARSRKSSSGGAPGSPPYMSRSPASSTSRHAKTHRTELSPRSAKSKKSNGGGHRTRRPSNSAQSDAASEYYMSPAANGTADDLRPDYYSGLEEGSSDEDGSGSSEVSDDELGDEDIPVTGFAVASNKRNADFHELFPAVPEGDYLIEDYGCALQREILIQGRLYISENHICFHANIFGWITDLSIPIYEITTLEKKMTAFVIPNAIQLTTRQAKYTFASFLARDTTFDVIYNIWRLARPEDNISVLSSGRGSMEGPGIGAGGPAGSPPGGGGAPAAAAAASNATRTITRKVTQCTCGKENQHYSEVAMEIIIPGTPDKIQNLIFASGFIKDFMVGNQKLFDIQMSDWSPVSPGSKLLTRNMSYIKPLNGSIGPKQTKCEIKDEMVHFDTENYISTVTSTRTPEVPSGGVFVVKTRTCITWASPVSSKVVVTTQVEWSGRSFIKGIIERSAIDGQKVYHTDLEKAMRAYITEHQAEFLPEGIDVVAVTLAAEPAAAEEAATALEAAKDTEEEQKQRERERNARGLQWAWDTFDGAFEVAKKSTKGALELVRDAWDQSTSTTILWFVIVILVLSNLWTLMRAGSSKEEAERKLEVRKIEEREKWVQSIVTALWDELAAGKREAGSVADEVLQHRPGPVVSTAMVPVETPSMQEVFSTPLTMPVPASTSAPTPSSLLGLKEEIQQLHQSLNAFEERLQAIRQSLTHIEGLNSLD